MSKLEDARMILKQVGMPDKQQSDVCCYTLLAMANISGTTDWRNADSKWIRIHDIIAFIADHYGISYAENSHETIRKQAIHHFRNAALIEIMAKLPILPTSAIELPWKCFHCCNPMELQTGLTASQFLPQTMPD